VLVTPRPVTPRARYRARSVRPPIGARVVRAIIVAVAAMDSPSATGSPAAADAPGVRDREQKALMRPSSRWNWSARPLGPGSGVAALKERELAGHDHGRHLLAPAAARPTPSASGCTRFRSAHRSTAGSRAGRILVPSHHLGHASSAFTRSRRGGISASARPRDTPPTPPRLRRELGDLLGQLLVVAERSQALRRPGQLPVRTASPGRAPPAAPRPTQPVGHRVRTVTGLAAASERRRAFPADGGGRVAHRAEPDRGRSVRHRHRHRRPTGVLIDLLHGVIQDFREDARTDAGARTAADPTRGPARPDPREGGGQRPLTLQAHAGARGTRTATWPRRPASQAWPAGTRVLGQARGRHLGLGASERSTGQPVRRQQIGEGDRPDRMRLPSSGP